MALTVEDGTGLSGANAYVDVAFADAYFLERGNSNWTGAATDKEVALIVATEYADLRWRRRLKGVPLTRDQALEFPRAGLWDRYGRSLDAIPESWKKAVCEYAVQALSGTLMEESVVGGPAVKRKKTVVGPLTTEVEYATSATPKAFPKADLLVRPLLAGSGGAVRN